MLLICYYILNLLISSRNNNIHTYVTIPTEISFNRYEFTVAEIFEFFRTFSKY